MQSNLLRNFSKLITLKSVFFQLLFAKGNKSPFYAILSLFISFSSYILEVLFAISLQRFLGSANLIEQVAETRFFGGLKDARTEALFLVSIGALRSFMQAANTVCVGQTLIEFEKFTRKVQILDVFSEKRRDIGTDAALFGNIVTGGSNFVANSFVYIGKISITLLLLFTLGMYSLTLTFQILIVIALSAPLQRYFVDKTLKFSYSVRELIINSTSEFLITIKNFEFLKVHHLVHYRSRRNISHVENLASFRHKQYLFTALRSLLPQLLGVLTLVFIISSERIQTLDNKSEIVPFLYLLIRFFQNMADLTRMNSIIAQDWPNVRLLSESFKPKQSAAELEEFEKSLLPQVRLEEMSKNLNRLFSSGVGIRMTSVSYSMDDGKRVLKIPKISIRPGELVVIDGPSGIGKTTLLRLISGYYLPATGEIEFFSSDDVRANYGSEQTEFEYRSVSREHVAISYLAAECPLITGTLFENLQFGNVEILSAPVALEALRTVKLDSLIENGDQLSKVIHESGSGLSSGQRQRLGFARAILQNPKLLILDEALSQIDDEARTDLLNVIYAMKDSITILSVSHNFDISSEANKIIRFQTSGQTTLVEIDNRNG